MNWSKAKTILIIFFICTDLFLLFISLFFTSDRKSVSEEIIHSTMDVLENNAIFVDKNLLRRENKAVAIPYAENAIKNYEDFAKKLIGENIKQTDDNSFENENGAIYFNGDRFDFVPAENYTEKNFDNVSVQSSIKVSIKLLESLGINLLNTDEEIVYNDDGYTVLITKSKRDYVYFSSDISIKFVDDKIVDVSGIWFEEKSYSKEKKSQKPTYMLLVDCIAEFGGKNLSVSDVKSGFYISDTEKYHKTAELSPCIRITFSNGEDVILNSGE